MSVQSTWYMKRLLQSKKINNILLLIGLLEKKFGKSWMNANDFIRENEFRNVVCKIMIILSRPHCVKNVICRCYITESYICIYIHYNIYIHFNKDSCWVENECILNIYNYHPLRCKTTSRVFSFPCDWLLTVKWKFQPNHRLFDSMCIPIKIIINITQWYVHLINNAMGGCKTNC